MSDPRHARAWTILGAVVLALTVGAVARRAGEPKPQAEELRDAVAAPVSPAMLGGARVIQPNAAGYFASPANRRAEAEQALMSSRLHKVSKAMQVRAAQLRREAAAARAVSAQ